MAASLKIQDVSDSTDDAKARVQRRRSFCYGVGIFATLTVFAVIAIVFLTIGTGPACPDTKASAGGAHVDGRMLSDDDDEACEQAPPGTVEAMAAMLGTKDHIYSPDFNKKLMATLEEYIEIEGYDLVLTQEHLNSKQAKVVEKAFRNIRKHRRTTTEKLKKQVQKFAKDTEACKVRVELYGRNGRLGRQVVYNAKEKPKAVVELKKRTPPPVPDRKAVIKPDPRRKDLLAELKQKQAVSGPKKL